jgi:hypothetical protein
MRTGARALRQRCGKLAAFRSAKKSLEAASGFFPAATWHAAFSEVCRCRKIAENIPQSCHAPVMFHAARSSIDGLLRIAAAQATPVHGNSRESVVASGRFSTGRRIMILGLSLSTFVLVHVIISVIAIVAGFVVMSGMLGSRPMPGWTAVFLLLTILTSATGFLIPPLVSEKLLPSHVVGALSLLLLAIACLALYGQKLSGSWRWIFVLTALLAQYLNVFVLVIQSFLKIAPLHALAPSVPPSEPPFAILQGIVLVFFIVFIIGAVRRFHPAPRFA